MVFLYAAAVLLLLLIIPFKITVKVYFSLERGTAVVAAYLFGLFLFKFKILKNKNEALTLQLNGKEKKLKTFKKTSVKGGWGSALGFIKPSEARFIMRYGHKNPFRTAITISAVNEVIARFNGKGNISAAVIPCFNKEEATFYAEASFYLTVLKIFLMVTPILFNVKKKKAAVTA